MAEQISMPQPDWLKAEEGEILTRQLPVEEAQAAGLAFVKQMAAAGILPTDAVVISAADLSKLLTSANFGIDSPPELALLMFRVSDLLVKAYS